MTLRWETRNVREFEIRDNRGNEIFSTTDEDVMEEGDLLVRPTRDTEYRLMLERSGQREICEVEIKVGGDVTFISDVQPLASISLSAVPYTGFDAGPVATGIFYSLVGLWSAALAYVFVFKKTGMFAGLAFLARRTNSPAPGTYGTHAAFSATATAPMNLPVSDTYAPTATYEEEVEREGAHLEERAHQKNVLLSSDALRFIISQAESAEDEVALLDAIVGRAKEAYPREDGWIVINRARISELFASDTAAQPTAEEAASGVEETSLAQAIVAGDVVAAYAALGDEPLRALVAAATALDGVFRARRGEGTADAALATAGAHLADAQLEEAIAALTTAIDGTYHDEAAAVKLAVLKAANAVA